MNLSNSIELINRYRVDRVPQVFKKTIDCLINYRVRRSKIDHLGLTIVGDESLSSSQAC